MDLLNEISRLAGVKKVFLNSGIRHDLILMDKQKGGAYLKQVIANHVSGQMKLAPEHCAPGVLALMGKPGMDSLVAFKHRFDRICKTLNKKQYLTYYLIAAHPGCTVREMNELKEFTRNELHITPEQVQIFTPTPSTFSTLMYCTGIDPFAMGARVCGKRSPGKREAKTDCHPENRTPAPSPIPAKPESGQIFQAGQKEPPPEKITPCLSGRTRGIALLYPNPACSQIKNHGCQDKIPEHMDIFGFQNIG